MGGQLQQESVTTCHLEQMDQYTLKPVPMGRMLIPILHLLMEYEEYICLSNLCLWVECLYIPYILQDPVACSLPAPPSKPYSSPSSSSSLPASLPPPDPPPAPQLLLASFLAAAEDPPAAVRGAYEVGTSSGSSRAKAPSRPFLCGCGMKWECEMKCGVVCHALLVMKA